MDVMGGVGRSAHNSRFTARHDRGRIVAGGGMAADQADQVREPHGGRDALAGNIAEEDPGALRRHP